MNPLNEGDDFSLIFYYGIIKIEIKISLESYWSTSWKALTICFKTNCFHDYTFCWYISVIKCLHIKKDIKTITFSTENLWTQFYFESILCSWVCEFWIKINNWFYGFADTSFCTNIRKQLIIWDTIKICTYTRKWKWKTILSILGAQYHQQPDLKKTQIQIWKES